MTPRSWIRKLFARTPRPVRKAPTRRRPCLEALEDRTLLSGGSATPPASAFTPAMIQRAYGIAFLGAGNQGQGQTVAIVDPYDSPTVTQDLATFCTQFGLPQMDGLNGHPTFTKLYEYGPTNPPPPAPPYPSGIWGGEIALDVEWAHAIAPRANIVLVEANSPSDLYIATSIAAAQPGVSVVSMSWGNGENPLLDDDSVFQTPSGHNGVTFVAGTGDDGQPGIYPAYSPNVLAVGGTSLTTDPSGNYLSESGWSGSGGGVSQYESRPSYQPTRYSNGSTSPALSMRGIPDVSFVADPNTGVAICDSYDFGAGTPWIQDAGTSLATPCWAGLIAIANQERVANGLPTLDGPGQTLPALYNLYNDSGRYAADFHDITTGNNGYAAGPGYDLVTGIGSPIANNLVADLARDPTTTSLSASPSPAVLGLPVTLTATVSSYVPGDAPTGTVAFLDGDVLLGTVSLNGNAQATLTTSALSLGTHHIRAVYSGNQAFAASAFTFGPTSVQSVIPASGLSVPRGVAVDGAGDVFIADPSNHRVLEVMPDGTQTTVASGFTPFGVAVDGSGNLFFTDGGLNRVVEVNLASGTLTTVGPLLNSPEGVAVDGSGDVFIADAGTNRVLEVKADGSQTTVGSGLNLPTDVAVDVSGDVFIADSRNNRVVEVTPLGNQTTVASRLSTPIDVAVDRSDDLFISDFGNSRVVEVTPSRTQTTVCSGLTPEGVVVDGAGDVFVADAGNNRVVEVIPGLPVTVNQHATTTTAVSSSADPSFLSQSVTFTATVTVNAPGAPAPTGTVQFQIDGANFGAPVALSGGSATSAPVGTLSLGSHSITAVYSGDANDLGSTGTLSGGQMVNLDATTTSLTSSADPSFFSQSVTFTATVTGNAPGAPTPTGTVQFRIDGVNFGGPVALSGGSATSAPISTLAVGNHVITAVYNGDAYDLGSTGTLSGGQTVNLDPTTTTVSVSPNPSFLGQPVTLTATVLANAPGAGTPTGTVSFYDGTTLLATRFLSGNLAKATWTTAALAVGSHTISVRYSGDSGFGGSATVSESVFPASRLNQPSGVAVDGAGDVFIADQWNARVVEVKPDGTPTTVLSFPPFTGPYPTGVAVDGAGDVFVALTDRVVEVKADGTQTTVASGLNHPSEVAVDGAGDVFIADAYNSRVLEVTPTGAIQVGSGLNQPYGVAVDGAGDVFIADTFNNRVVEVKADGTQTTVASGLNRPRGVAVDGAGDVFIADTDNNRVVEVTPTGTWIQVASGLNEPFGVAVDGADNVFIADTFNSRIVKVTLGVPMTVNPAASTTTVRSSPDPSVLGQSVTFTATVTASSPSIPTPTGTVQFRIDGVNFGGPVALSGGSATSAPVGTLSLGNHAITAVYSGDSDLLPSTGTLSGGQTVNPYPTSISVSASRASLAYGQSETLTATVTTPSGDPTPTAADGTVSFYDGATLLGTATLSGSPATATWTTAALAAGAHTITARYSGASTFAASASGVEPASVQAAVPASGLNAPYGVAVDGAGDVFIADARNNRVVEVKADGTQTTVASGLNSPLGVAVDGAGDVFIADVNYNRVVEVKADGTQTTVGSGLNSPLGVAVDGAGDVFIADAGNNRVVKVTPLGAQTTVGSGLSRAAGVAVDGAGDVFIADTFNYRVVEVKVDGTQTTVASGLNQPYGVAVDGAGDVFIADTFNYRVVEVKVDGTQTTVASGLGNPYGVAVDGAGDVFIADVNDGRVVKVTVGVPVTVSAATASIVVTPYGVTYDGTAHTPGGTAAGTGGVDLSAYLSLSGTSHTGAGTYTDTWTFHDPNGNYLDASGTVSDRISPATLTVTAAPRTKVYGSADPALTYSATGFQFSDTAATVLSGGLTRAAGEAVGSYAIGQGTLAANGNYTIAFTGNSLAITPATLTVTADPKTKVYGSADPALTYAVGGLQFKDTAAAVLSGGLARAAGETVAGGPYAIGQGTLAANSNYTIAFTGNSLVITPATLTVTPGAGQSKVYGATVPALTYTISGLVNNDPPSTLTGSLGTTATAASPVGTYAFTLGTLSAGSNYAVALAADAPTFAVTPATPAVQVTAASGPYNQSPFAATATVAGVNGIAGPSLENVTPTLTYYAGPTASGTPLSGAPLLPGTYTVKAAFAGSPDYTAASATATFTIQTPTTSVTGPTIGVPGQPLTYAFAVNGPTQGIVFTINYGDGTSLKTSAGGPSLKLDHLYTAPGSFTIQVTATDPNNVVSQLATQAINITAVALEADPTDPSKTALFVGGTTAADTITIKPADANGTLDVKIGQTDLGNFKPTGHLVVYGQAGDDTIKLQTNVINNVTVYVSTPAFLFGDDGNDTLNTAGSTANNVLVGGAGNDTLQAGSGRDLLIGGTGADVLHGDGGDDILIGGTTDFDSNLSALNAIMAEWGRTDADYNTRVKHLSGTLSGGLNGSTLLKAGTGGTVHDDAAIDTLYGEGGSDWFFALLSGTTKDTVKDQATGEIITGL